MTVRSFLIRWGPALLYAGLIFSLSAMPRPPLAASAPDEILHAVEYGVLGLACLWGVAGRWGGSGARAAAVAWALATAYGMTDEYHQSFVEGRYASWGDLAADSVGAALAVTLAQWLPTRSSPGPVELTLYHRENCHLCTEMESAVRRSGTATRIHRVDVDSDPELRARYGDQVPVLAYQGRPIAKSRFDERALRSKLARLVSRGGEASGAES